MQNKHTYVAIMAGGIGSRFWPGSRESKPKQFMDMLGVGKSLLRLTYERFLPVCAPERIFIVTNAAYKTLIQEQIPELSENQIVCEPSRNNTGPCVAYTAFKLAALDPQANFVIAPSDHIVLKEAAFLEKISLALDFAAENNALLTLGIQPSRPDTGYGYIQYEKGGKNGICKVKRFAEKPDADTARAFLASGEYLWNAGIFIWNVQSILQAFESLSPDIYNILKAGQGQYNTASETAFIQENYPTTPNISVDFAIMEKAENVYTIPAEFGWSDLGTWASLHAECPKDENDNAIQGKHILAIDTDNCLIRSEGDKLIVVKELSDYIVVDTADALLIYPKSKEQEIKQVTSLVKSHFGSDYL
jgi:mannose-1-phosphate guanylyltransferase